MSVRVGGVPEEALGTGLAVVARGVVIAVLLLTHPTLVRIEVAEVRVESRWVHNRRVESHGLWRDVESDALPCLGVTGGGMLVTLALLTDGAPLVAPGGEVARAAELAGAAGVSNRTLTDLNTQGRVRGLRTLLHGAVH